MASFHHQIKSGKKGAAVSHSDYIVRDGKHSQREDVIATAYGNMPECVEGDPRCFWRAADKHERKNAAAYREHEIALPDELTEDQQVAVAKQHIADIAGDKPYQYAIHGNQSSLEGVMNVHLHLMVSDRVPDGIDRPLEQIFRRYNRKQPEKGGWRKDSGGRTPAQLTDDVLTLKKRTAEVQNAALSRHGHLANLDPRSLKEQGIDREPERHLGQARIRKMSTKEKQAYVAGRRGGEEIEFALFDWAPRSKLWAPGLTSMLNPM